MSTSKLVVSITVDWEGEHLRDLGDLQATRAAIERSLGAGVPFTHYICPTYWLGAQLPPDPARAIRSVVRKGDELALHVHGWRALVEGAGVRFLSEPDWNGDGTGHGVPLGVYRGDVGAILASARDLLQRHRRDRLGFPLRRGDDLRRRVRGADGARVPGRDFARRLLPA
ncbi:MAG: hypothetical protein R3B09_28790 [Nannocystaceae bacterium]